MVSIGAMLYPNLKFGGVLAKHTVPLVFSSNSSWNLFFFFFSINSRLVNTFAYTFAESKLIVHSPKLLFSSFSLFVFYSPFVLKSTTTSQGKFKCLYYEKKGRVYQLRLYFVPLYCFTYGHVLKISVKYSG